MNDAVADEVVTRDEAATEAALEADAALAAQAALEADAALAAQATLAAQAALAAQAEELLRAGAVLPPGTSGGGDRAVPVFTQAYRHPGLDDRIVVRLVAAGQGEGLGAGFLGLEPEGEPTEVGLGQPRALGFPEWVLVHHPSDGHLAMSLVDEMDKVARTVRSRPKKARATYESIGERLAGAVPHFLPTFYEQAGRVFLAADEKAYATQMFVNARKAETAHALPFDEARMDAVFLEFALAEAVPSRMLSSYAKGLSSRVPAATAFRHLRGLFVRLAANGLPPSSPGAGDLRRLAKAVAGKNALAEEVRFLGEMLVLPGTVKAPPGWWKAHRPALLELTRREPAFRGTLLELMPSEWEREELPQWLDLLEKSGATAGLCDATLPAEVRPVDGTAGWTRRFLELCRATTWHLAPAGLYPLVDRMADTLRSELDASDGVLPPPVGDVNLLDQLLALGIPVADPTERQRLDLVVWAACDQRRDLVALEADVRFRQAFRRGCPTDDRAGHLETVNNLAESPGGSLMLAEWVGEVSRPYVTAELPALSGHRGALHTLGWLPGEVLAVAGQAVREALSSGIAPALARALRSGILDELGWPAWEEAVGAPESRDAPADVLIADAWPHLIVLADKRVRVIGAEGTVLTHELRVPDEVMRYPRDVSYHYVDGELLVWWRSRTAQGMEGYWHHDPSLRIAVEGSASSRISKVDGRDGMNGDLAPVSLPLPEGGRTTGGGVLRRGDTVVPRARRVIGDGTSYWVWARVGTDYRHRTWYAYDPVSDTKGEPGLPDWFDEGVRTAPEGSTFAAGWLLPAPSDVAGPLCSPVDGLLGWRVVTLPDGSRRGEDLAGRSVVVPHGRGRSPRWALEFPGADRPLAVIQEYDGIRLLDANGTVMSEIPRDHTAGTFTAGTPLLPPLRYWHLLQPRDPQGSAALRQVDEDTAAALLAAAETETERPEDTAGQDDPGREPADRESAGEQSMDKESADRESPGEQSKGGKSAGGELAGADGRDRLPGLIRTLLPQVGHEALRTGIAGVVRYAADQQRVLDAARARLDKALAGRVREESRPEPSDGALTAALQGLGLNGRRYLVAGRAYYYLKPSHTLFRLLGLLGDASRGLNEPAPAGSTHLALPEQAALSDMDWLALPTLPALLALRAGSTATTEDHRRVQDTFLAELDAQELAVLNPDHWRLVGLRLDKSLFEGPGALRSTMATVLQLDGGAFLVFPNEWSRSDADGSVFRAVFHDPAGRFDAPAPYTLMSTEPFVPEPTRAPGWFTAFRAELAARGPAPWYPAAAEEFSRLTGITPTMARLVVAGVPLTDDEHKPVPAETLKTIGVKSADVAVAREALGYGDAGIWQAVLAALLPAEPSGLWTDGPDVVAAAEVWNRRAGRRTPLPEDVLHDAVRTVRTASWWTPSEALHGFLNRAAEPQLTHDLTWTTGDGHYLRPVENTPGFDARALNGSVALAAWLAHRLPSGDPIRAALPGVLTSIRARLAHPDLLISLGRRVDLEAFRRDAGLPTETGDDFIRYGALVLSTAVSDPVAAVRPALLDSAGNDPHLAAVAPGERPAAEEIALRLVHDQRFAELLADPGQPMAGGRDADGLWWPQDPARSVPDLVGEVTKRYGIGEDAAVLYLMLLAMPDPTDHNTARWTGWAKQRGGTARLRAARAELAATDLVLEGSRTRAGRSLFLPGGWTHLAKPYVPLERWKVPMYELLHDEEPLLGVIAPTGPVADLYRTAWRRIQDGDEPRLEELQVPRPRKGRG
ncbi:DNA-binding protein [Streptomyces sp. NBC_00878]|uniref:DNA-binding protein n=1 Tax=Streptomyces sp. NBC_00878 TaxID=2975854 RepID=UPI002251F504|nr:DNA-binding protein [Streptomyces sp. NBC_00878]MCX4910654.1 DNA-binding protein [Streptomyces sp. NBC_00878]